MSDVPGNEEKMEAKRKKRKKQLLALIISLIFIGIISTPAGWRGLAVIFGGRAERIADQMERQSRTEEEA